MDASRKPLEMRDPRSLSTSYVRDGFGDIIQRTSPNSGTTVYYYNALNVRFWP